MDSNTSGGAGEMVTNLLDPAFNFDTALDLNLKIPEY
jgi:hypothetical protein